MEEEQDQYRKALDKSLEQCDAKLNKADGKSPHEYASEGISMVTDPIDHSGSSSSLNSCQSDQLHKTTYWHGVHHQSVHSPQRTHGNGSPPTWDYCHSTRKGTSSDAPIDVFSGAQPHETHMTRSEDGVPMDKNSKTEEIKSRKHGHGSTPTRDYCHTTPMGTSADAQIGVLSGAHPGKAHITSSEDCVSMDKNGKTYEMKTEKKESSEERISKEMEKQHILRRIMEERMRNEMEKEERARKKKEEKIIREKQRQEEKLQREEKRESERREKFLQKSFVKAEKEKQKEELRKEKELVKQIVAVERAAKRKIAKESTELIEDDRLELMELAAQRKGLPAITSLDHDTLQNLELFREFLIKFPPESVQLKRPFAFKPWIKSDENIGNLLMVWRFCMTFADVMGISPFTLDELVQAFHETDSRLLGEIHISLLKLIIKDVENVSRASSVSVGANHFSTTIPACGHPDFVDGAYKWGFDILEWKEQLGPMSWPEILRQFALSAGFGPKLREEDETKGSEEIVTSLRNGVAAQKAVEQMQRKGFSSQKKPKYQLTPGTLKYAAHIVLSLEGSKGLTVKKLAQKIQECGLRDLSTSNNPEASLSVVLSTHTALFQRTAPSTYRVPTRFRKDPADAESILSAAREKIKHNEDGFTMERNAVVDIEKVDSEGNVEDILKLKDLDISDILEDRREMLLTMERNAVVDVEKDDSEGNVEEILKVKDLDSSNMSKDRSIERGNTVQGCTEVDRTQLGESWVQGLVTGEYADLPAQERLDALVSLIEIVNQGTSIREIIQDRFDNASTLKKKMWAEAQLDKKWITEVNSKSHHASSMGEDEMKQENMNNICHDGSLVASSQSIYHNLHGNTTKRAKLGLKSYLDHKAEETYVYRALPLGQDRRRNRYWEFGLSASVNDPDSARIFVESPTGQWRVFDTEEAFDALCSSLDPRGVRESHLYVMLREIENAFKKNVKNKGISVIH